MNRSISLFAALALAACGGKLEAEPTPPPPAPDAAAPDVAPPEAAPDASDDTCLAAKQDCSDASPDAVSTPQQAYCEIAVTPPAPVTDYECGSPSLWGFKMTADGPLIDCSTKAVLCPEGNPCTYYPTGMSGTCHWK